MFKVLGGGKTLTDHVLAQVGQHRSFQVLGNGVAVPRALGRPVGAAVQMRYGAEGIEGVAARRCHARFGGRGAVQVQAEVLGQVVALEDVVQQFLVAWPHQDHVVGHVFIALVGAEVPDKHAHRITPLVHFLVGPVAAVLRCDELAVRPHGVGVGHHHVGRDALAIGQQHTGDLATALGRGHTFDAGHFGIHAHRATQALDQAHHALDDLAWAAHGPVHAKAALQRVDQCVDASHRKRIAANEQRVKAHHHAQLRVLEVPRHHAVDAAPAAHLDEVGHGAHQVAQRVIGDGAELFKTELVADSCFLDEALKPGQVFRAEAPDFRAHAVDVAAVVKPRAVVKADAIEGLHGPQVHVVGQLASGQSPQLFEHEGGGDDGGAGVEGEAVLLVHVGAAAGGVKLFQQRHLPTLGGHAHGRSQAAKTAANDHRMRPAARHHAT